MAERDGVLAGYTRTEWWQEAAYDLYKGRGFEVVESFRTYRKPLDPTG